MARLVTLPYEIGGGANNGALEAFQSKTGTGTVTLDAAVFSQAPSRGSYKVTAAAGTDTGYAANDIATVLGRRYFHRVRLAVSALPTSATRIMTCLDGVSASVASIRLTAAGKIQVWNDVAGTQVGSDSAFTVTAGSSNWFRVDLSVTLGTGAIDTIEGRVDGTVIGTATALALSDQVIDYFPVGLATAPGSAMNLWMDDGAINDDQGASENSYPPDNYVALLKPTADSSRVGFTTGAGGTTALWDAVNNTPPVGVVLASATALTQIKDATSNITDNYVATMETYTAAGVPAGATVAVVQALAAIGGSTTAAQSHGLTIVTNPAGTERTANSPGAAAGTWDASWWGLWTAAIYLPTVTLGTAPTLKIRQNTASVVSRMVAFMGMVADVALPPRVPHQQVVLQAVSRAAVS